MEVPVLAASVDDETVITSPHVHKVADAGHSGRNDAVQEHPQVDEKPVSKRGWFRSVFDLADSYRPKRGSNIRKG